MKKMNIKKSFFSFKIIIITFLLLLGVSLTYLSSEPKVQAKEIYKEIQPNKKL